MRKLKYWHLLPLLSLFIFFINSADAAGAEGEQEQIITLQETSADQLAEMKARMTSKAGFTQAQRSNPWEGRPRRTQTIRNIGDIDLGLNWLDMPAVEEGRFTRSLAKTMVAAPITVTVNGAVSTTLAPGDSLEIEITFSSGFTEAEASFWVDIDGDGALNETIDFDLDEGGLAVDNGTDDLSSGAGVFKIILYPDEEEGFLTVTNLKLLLVVEDDGGTATATITVGESPTSNYASGTVTPTVANVIIVAFPTSRLSMDSPDGFDDFLPHLTVTDASGLYNIYLAAADSLEIFSADFLGVQDGLVPDTAYSNKFITGPVTGLNFNYVEPTAFITGFVKDGEGFFVPGVTVFAFPDGPGGEFEATTDANGAYTMGVLPGHYYMEISDEVIPEYMGSEGNPVDVLDGETATANFTIYRASSTITGTVMLDGAPLGGIEIVAWGQPQGATDVAGNGMWTYTESDQLTGEYVLNVSPLVNNDGYFLWPWNWPDSTYMNNPLDHIPAGASMVNIDFKTATGGLYGVVTVLGSSPVDTLLDVGIFIYDSTAGFETWTSPDWETGEYRVHLPPGNYYIDVYTREFEPYMAGPIAVASTFKQHNIALDEIVFDSAIFGQVTDAEGLFGLGGADVWIGSQTIEYGDHMLTDSVGNFYFEVPASNYEVGTQAEGYFGAHLAVTAPAAGFVEASFALEKFNFRPPVIISIRDQNDPPDQGGWALINFAGGSSDSGPFFGWSIWSVPGEDYVPEQMINVGFFLGDGRPNYTVLVPTFVDSNSTNGGTRALYESWYVITGFGDSDDGGGMFIANSQPAAGWSVDNLAPGVPAGLSLSTSTVAGEFSLAWDASGDTDYQYNVVRVAYTSGSEVLLNVSGTSIALTSANITLGSEFEVSVAAVDYNGNYSSFSIALNSVTLDLEDGMSLPGKYALLVNYPNPFNPSTVLQFELPQSDRVSLIVYDLTGREIRSLISSDLPAGHHRVVWDGRDGRGYGIATGVYFYRIVTGSGFTATRKMVFMK